MQVFQTEGLPPKSGRRILPVIGWTTKSSEAEAKSAAAKSGNTSGAYVTRSNGTLPSRVRKAVFLDRDDTLIRRVGPPNSTPDASAGDLVDPKKVELIPGAAEACRRLSAGGYALVVVTNQGAVARGACDMRRVEEINALIHASIKAELGGRHHGELIDAFYFCPFHPNGSVPAFTRDHPWRKPGPGMILAAAAELGLDLSRSWLVGDSERDIRAGIAAGIDPSRGILLGTDGTLLGASELILRGHEPSAESCVVRLRALSGEPLADADVRQTVEAAAHAAAERAGVRLLSLETTPTALTVTLATDKLAGMGFMAELRRATNSWYEKKYRDGPLWGTAGDSARDQ